MPNDNKTKTYVLNGKTYTVPADTSMEELDQFIQGQATPQPIQDNSSLSARPSLLGRSWSALKEGGPTALGEELGRSTREAVGGLPLPGVNKTLGQGLTDLGQMANMAGTEASLLQAPQLGEGIVNLGRSGLPLLRSSLARMVREPATGKVQSPWEIAINKALPDPNAPTAIPAEPIPKGTNYGQFLEAQKSVPMSKIPNRLPPSLRGDPFNPEQSTPRLGTNRATGVSVYPEPREPMPGDRPGAAWSQGRESTLPASAQRGAPGAVDVLRNIGKPIVLTPREGVGYPPAGEFEAMRESLGNPQAPQPPQGVYEPGERESYLDSVIRGSSGENRDYSSLLRKLQKTRPKPLF